MLSTTTFSRALATALVVFVIALFTAPRSAIAQKPLAKNQNAVIAVELRLDRLRQNSLSENDAIKSILAATQKNLPFPGVRIENVERIFAAFSLPESMDAVMAPMVEAPLPMEMVARIKFDNGDAASAMYAAISDSRFAEEIEVDGHKYIRPLDEATNLRCHQLDLTTIEFATEVYLTQQTGDLFSEGLKKSWNAMPDHALRVAVDLQGRRDFVDQLIAVAKSELPPLAGGFLDLADKATAVQLSMDLSDDHLVTFNAVGVDEEQSEELREGLDALLGMGKMMGQQMLPMLQKENPADARISQAILDSLTASREGTHVRIAIPKPTGFDEFVVRSAEKALVSARQIDELNRFREYAIAVHVYYDAYRSFPISGDDKLSWRVRVLPFLEQAKIFQQMNVDEPWDSDTNKPFAHQMPAIYGENGSTTDVGWVIPDTLPADFAAITDGTSNSIMLLQVPDGMAWTQPNDLSLDQAVKLLDNLPAGQSLIAAFYDGSVRRIDGTIDRTVFRNMLDPNDGNVIDR